MLELAESHLSLFIYLFQTVFLDELLAAEKKKKRQTWLLEETLKISVHLKSSLQWLFELVNLL